MAATKRTFTQADVESLEIKELEEFIDTAKTQLLVKKQRRERDSIMRGLYGHGMQCSKTRVDLPCIEAPLPCQFIRYGCKNYSEPELVDEVQWKDEQPPKWVERFGCECDIDKDDDAKETGVWDHPGDYDDPDECDAEVPHYIYLVPLTLPLPWKQSIQVVTQDDFDDESQRWISHDERGYVVHEKGGVEQTVLKTDEEIREFFAQELFVVPEDTEDSSESE
jgi:hypothetical protein